MSRKGTMDVGIVAELDPQHMPESVFVHEATARGLCFVRAYRWETSKRELTTPDGAEPLAQHVSIFAQGEETFVLRDCLVFFQLRGGDTFLRVAADSPVRHREIEVAMKAIYEVIEPAVDRREVEIMFWRGGSNGGSVSPRTVQVEPWMDIADNYAFRTRERLETLVALPHPPRGGRMLLWYGDSGTGKTRALEALAWEWRSWANFHYVTDPEKLFGDADYMMDVVLFKNPLYEENWRVLVLEDTGELLTPDAKIQTGQGLSRLLNLTDGLIGRLAKLILLVTTNEEVRALHPAVARPGRCAARVEFLPFSLSEAQRWLTGRGHEPRDPCPKHLADLYAAIESRTHEDRRKVVGFEPLSLAR